VKEFPQRGPHDHHRRFAGRAQALLRGTQGRVEAEGGQRRKGQGFAQAARADFDQSPARPQRAGFADPRDDARERCRLRGCKLQIRRVGLLGARRIAICMLNCSARF
jgi:hypothetical protein